MNKPDNYKGPMGVEVPDGYCDATSMDDRERTGMPGPDHPYYRLRSRILAVVEDNACSCVDADDLTDRVMDAI